MPFITDDMIAVLSAAALFPVLAGGHVLLFRAAQGRNAGSTRILAAFVGYAALWFGLYAVLRGSDGLSSPVSILAGLATVGFLCLGYMQVFSLTCRGFSLRILVDIECHGALDQAGIIREYSEGRGLDWMVEKRLASMEAFRLIKREPDGTVRLTPAGRWAGKTGLWVKALLRIEPGG